MVLLRHLLGDVLRRLRMRQGRTLREVSASARVSLGYLSEVERGQKEASSELLAAICAALETPLSQVFREVSDNFALAELQSEPVLGAPREPGLRVPAGTDGAALEGASLGGATLDRVATATLERPSGLDRTATAAAIERAALEQRQPGRDDDSGHVCDVTDMVPV
ncbi:MAG: helix-turn-helix transcriptional regulator [Streptosporangiaceae bacterium]|jgi:XRE family transcriptional regulator, stress-response regulator